MYQLVSMYISCLSSRVYSKVSSAFISQSGGTSPAYHPVSTVRCRQHVSVSWFVHLLLIFQCLESCLVGMYQSVSMYTSRLSSSVYSQASSACISQLVCTSRAYLPVSRVMPGWDVSVSQYVHLALIIQCLQSGVICMYLSVSMYISC